MLRALIARPISIAIATLALVVIGVFSLLRLPVSLLPSLERPRLVVSARSAEMARQELVEHVVEPLERRLTSLEGVVEVHSMIDDGQCSVALETEWQTDIDRLRIDVERRLAETAGVGLDELSVRVEAGDRGPVMEIAVLGGHSEYARTSFADKVLIPELGHVNGVGRVRRLGGAQLRPVVRPQAAALMARGLTSADIVDRLADLGTSRPIGRLRDGGIVRPLVLYEPVANLQELAGVRLPGAASGSGPAPEGPGTTLGDVATISYEEVPQAGAFRLDGEPGVLVEVYRAPGANAVLLARQTRQLLQELRGRQQGHLRVSLVRDASREVVDALTQLGLAGLLGLLLGALVLRFMLGSWRPTLALAVVVPASILAAFSGFYLWDVSLDIVSLAGLALAAGMLVDNSIVVLEAIESARSRGSDAAEAEGSEQIAMALVASFLTTAVVFVPLIYLHGLARAFFGVQAFAIVTTLAISLLLSLTLTPVLARRFEKGSAAAGRSPGRGLYLKCLDGVLGRPWTVGLVVVAVLALGTMAFGQLERQLIPAGTSSILEFDFRLPAGLDQDAVDERLRALQAAADAVDTGSPRSVLVFRGADEERQESLRESLRGTLEWSLSSPGDAEEGVREARRALASVVGVKGQLRWRRSAVAAAMRSSSDDLQIEITSSSPRRAEHLARRVVTHLESSEVRLSDLGSLTADTSLARPSLALSWDRMRLARLATDADQLSQQVRLALGGQSVGRMEPGSGEPEILVEATEPRELRLLPVRTTVEEAPGERRSRVVPLAALGDIQAQRLEPPLERRNGRPAVSLSIDRQAGGATPREISEALAGLPKSADESTRLRGQTWEMQRSFVQLRLALGLALLLVFLTVAALYESLSMPLVVMTTVPLAAAGALGGLWVSGQSFNVMSFLGLILLAGIVVNNAIVLVHRAEQGLNEGLAPRAAILQAAGERYRPILMTTLTTLLGMIPLAALGGQGTELRRALAVSVSGGLITSMVAALVVVPVFYLAWARRTETPRQGAEQS